MLYRLIFGNIASFAENVEFDMFPNLKRENFNHHVYNYDNGIPVLKSCALYGANGSGKSNFIYVIKLIKRFATEFNLNSNPNWVISFFMANRFKLPILNDTPMSFLIEFGNEKGAYIYTFDLTEEGVSEETLYRSGLGKTENSLIYERVFNNVRFDSQIATDEITKVIKRQLDSNPSLSVFSILGRLRLLENVFISDAFDWMVNKLEVIEVDYQIPWLIDQLSHQPEMMSFVKKAFSNVGLGVEDLSIKNESFDDWIKHANVEDKHTISRVLESLSKESGNKTFSKMDRQFPLLTFTEEDGVRTVKELLFHQSGIDGYVGTMECEAQSSGTLRLLTLIPAIYYAIYEGKTIIIDEIDNSIHPILIKGLIKFFGNSNSNGQLIFTTHETALLNQQELLRPDEVWMIEKKYGISNMYSLNDFKIHKTLSLENGYLDGRFGAIPFLGSIDILKDEN